jgi:hypothetical protein
MKRHTKPLIKLEIYVSSIKKQAVLAESACTINEHFTRLFAEEETLSRKLLLAVDSTNIFKRIDPWIEIELQNV